MMLLHHKTQSSKHPKTNPTQILRVVPSGVGATERLLARKWWCRQEMGHSLSWDLPWHWSKPRRMQGFDHWPYDGTMVGQNTRKRSSQQRSWSFLCGATNPWNFDHRVWRCAVSWILNHSSFHFEPSFFFEIWWLPPYFYLQSLGPLLGGFPTWCNKTTRAPIKMDWKSCVTRSARMRLSSKPWRRIISMVPQQVVVERLDRMLPRPGPWPPRSGKVRPHGVAWRGWPYLESA